jgi:hypothetical protein
MEEFEDLRMEEFEDLSYCPNPDALTSSHP